MTETSEKILGFTREELVNTRPAVIDGDSFAYIISYNHKDFDDVDAVINHVDDFLHTILKAVQSRLIVGVLNPKNEFNGPLAVRNFRADIAVTKEYKGNRGEKPEWYQKWAPVIENRLITEWGFKRVANHLEADDVVATLMLILNSIEGCTPTCCGCDKDLHQIPGNHYDYKKNEGFFIDHQTALKKLFTQVLLGDSTDNIPGLAGTGKVGAEKILSSEGVDSTNFHVAALFAFNLKLGLDKGIQSFYENYMLCALRGDSPVDGYTLKLYDLEAAAAREMGHTEIEIIDFNPSIGDDGLFTVDI